MDFKANALPLHHKDSLFGGFSTSKVLHKSTGMETGKLHLCVVVSNLAFGSEIASSSLVFVKHGRGMGLSLTGDKRVMDSGILSVIIYK